MTVTPWKQALHAIQKAERLLIVADQKPDGDTLGSASAALTWLLREGKRVAAYCSAPIPRPFSFLDNIHHFTQDKKIMEQAYDVILTFDTGSFLRCGLEPYPAQWPSHHQVIVFDHHISNKGFGHVNLIFTDACSTAEVLYRFFQEHGIQIDERMATSLLTGIYTDTSFFANSATTNIGIQAAGHLVAQGARLSEISKYIMKNRSVDALRLWGIGLARLTHHPELDLFSTYFTLEDTKSLDPHSDVFEILINFLNAACGSASTVLVVRETTPGTVKGSLRSVSRDVELVAKLLGGGGLRRAAGFVVSGHLAVENGRPKITN